MERIRLMSHNIWNRDTNSPQWEEQGFDCSAAARVGGLVRVWQDTQPDIVGCQEASALMADLLKESLNEAGMNYTLIWGRFTPILFRSDKFDLVESEFGTYPEKIPGFDHIYNDQKSKAWNLAVFREKKSGKQFLFATTHLWWMYADLATKEKHPYWYREGSDDAREYQISILLEKIKIYREKYNCPAVLVGDLNTGYNSKAVSHILSQGFRHAHHIATEYAEESVGYHYCFPDGFKTHYDDAPFETAIDHIYVIGEKEGAVKRFERYSPEYYYPISDHSALYADIEF